MARAVSVDRAIVHAAARRTIMLGGADHNGKPSSWCVGWYFLTDAQAAVSFKALLDWPLPVEWDWSRCVTSNWFCLWVNM